MIKAVFFDIDGTLVSFDSHRIPQSTLSALDLLREKGIKIFIATGRAFISIDNLDGLTFDGYITLNGGYCIAGDGTVIYKNSISRKNIDSLIKQQEKGLQFPCMFATANEIFINYYNDSVNHILKLINFVPPPLMELKDASDKEIFQLMAFVNKDQEISLMNKILTECEATRWNPLFTDIIAKGNSKQTGMDKILDYYGISLDECMAFGDGGNDIPMLMHAPISIAMGNAANDVKQAASYITTDVDNDGVYNALKHFEII